MADSVSSRKSDLGLSADPRHESPGRALRYPKHRNVRLVKCDMDTHTHINQCGLVIDDGGRREAGFGTAEAGDCVARALTIANDEDYGVVYAELAWYSKEMGGKRSARDGVNRKVYKAWLAHRGWRWTPTMGIGTGCTVHLRADELPMGRLVVALSKHLVAVIDGVVYDNHDPRRSGARCVYGYWTEE